MKKGKRYDEPKLNLKKVFGTIITLAVAVMIIITINKILKKEAEKIEKKLNKKSFIITLEIEGKQLNSLEFANLIDKTIVNNSDITFIIGGSYGLSSDIKKLSNYRLSFSNMTFPHQLFRLIFIEQLYRSYKILNNETYHK